MAALFRKEVKTNEISRAHLVSPTAVRWNSFFDAVQRLLEYESKVLDNTMRKMKLTPLSPDERKCLTEYKIVSTYAVMYGCTYPRHANVILHIFVF